MKKLLIAVLAIVVCTTIFIASEDVETGEYGGPFRNMMQKQKQKRQLRRQRPKKVEIIDGKAVEVEVDEEV